ncbi:hypothetical protein Tco_1500383 [Tanacetum coccineum]
MMGTTMGTIRFAIHGYPDRYRTAIGNARTRSKIAKGLAIPVTMEQNVQDQFLAHVYITICDLIICGHLSIKFRDVALSFVVDILLIAVYQQQMIKQHLYQDFQFSLINPHRYFDDAEAFFSSSSPRVLCYKKRSCEKKDEIASRRRTPKNTEKEADENKKEGIQGYPRDMTKESGESSKKETSTPSTPQFQCPMLKPTNYSLYNKKDKTVIAFLYQSLPEEQLLQITKHKTAKAIWNALKTRHIGEERVQQARLQNLKSDFEMLHMKEDETIDTFTTKLTTLVNKAARLGHTMEDETLVRKLLNS